MVEVRLPAIFASSGHDGWKQRYMNMLRCLAGVLTLLFAGICFADEDPPLLLRHPTISAAQIVFVYGGDLWSAPRTGGVAVRLTSGVGRSGAPVFSPDGSEIAL